LGSVYAPVALAVSFAFLGFMLYKRVNLGTTLNATALLLGFLSLNWWEIPVKIFETSTDLLTISVVLATFGIMWLSQLYKDTGVINDLSESLSRIINNSKFILGVLPAVIGFLPVPGGALMSAPLVDSEAEKLKLKPEKKAYINTWFRHTIFPVYPISQLLIITAALTGITIPLIILRQIPVVVVMIIVGYFISFWRVLPETREKFSKNSRIASKRFIIAFSPILATILVTIALNLGGFDSAWLRFDVFVATFVGLIILILISKPNFQVFLMPLKRWGIYDVTLAAYGAFLLRNISIATGVPEIFKMLVASGSINVLLMLTFIPAVLGVITGSSSGGVAISVSILAENLAFSPKTAALLYMSAYLGYVGAPTHLCFTLTVGYFKSSLGKVYKYIIPSFLVSLATALLVYFLG